MVRILNQYVTVIIVFIGNYWLLVFYANRLLIF